MRSAIRSGKDIDPALEVKATVIVQMLSARAGIESPSCQVREMRSMASYDSIGDTIELSPRWFKLYDKRVSIAEGVLVHELGHCVRREARIAQTNLFAHVLMVYLGLACLFETPGILPRILLIVAGTSAWFLGRLVACAGSRRVEADADDFAKRQGYGDCLAEWLDGREPVDKMNFLRSHPTPAQRVMALTS